MGFSYCGCADAARGEGAGALTPPGAAAATRPVPRVPCGTGPPRGEGRRSRGSRPARRGVPPHRRPARCGTRSRPPRPGRSPRSRSRKAGAVRTGRRRGPAPRAGRRPDLPGGRRAGPSNGLVGGAVHIAQARHLAAGDGVVAVVEHRAHQQLTERARAPPVPGEEGERRGRTTARWRPRRRSGPGRRRSPARAPRSTQSGVHVLARRRVRVFGREPYSTETTTAPRSRAQASGSARQPVGAGHQAATVHAMDHRQPGPGGTGRGPAQEQGDTGRPRDRAPYGPPPRRRRPA